MVLTVVLSLLAGLAFRKRCPAARGAVLRGGGQPDHAVDHRLAGHRADVPPARHRRQGLLEALAEARRGYGTSLGLFTSGLGAQLTWTLPFGLLIMFAVFNRFNPAYEEAARDLGATPWQTFRHVVLPLIGPSLVGVGMFGFTLSWDEIARSSQAMGDLNTLPLELQGLTTTVTTPVIYALGTVTTVVSFLVMGVTLGTVWWWQRRGRTR
jgi:putative spermidine/putrescine transport system permease protein